jgi:hypothetical protein
MWSIAIIIRLTNARCAENREPQMYGPWQSTPHSLASNKLVILVMMLFRQLVDLSDENSAAWTLHG